MRALQAKGNDNIKLLASTVSAWGGQRKPLTG